MSRAQEFRLEPSPSGAPIRATPLEPLFTMLCMASYADLRYTYRKALVYDSDAALDEMLPSIGLTRRTYIEQIQLALEARGLDVGS